MWRATFVLTCAPSRNAIDHSNSLPPSKIMTDMNEQIMTSNLKLWNMWFRVTGLLWIYLCTLHGTGGTNALSVIKSQQQPRAGILAKGMWDDIWKKSHFSSYRNFTRIGTFTRTPHPVGCELTDWGMTIEHQKDWGRYHLWSNVIYPSFSRHGLLLYGPDRLATVFSD